MAVKRGQADLGSLDDSKDDSSLSNFAGSFARGFAHTAIQSPLEAAAQLIDHTVGAAFHTELYQKSVDAIIKAPEPAKFGSAAWHGETLGAALGMLPLVLASRAVVGKIGAHAIAESAITGAVYSLDFKPVHNNDARSGDSFWLNKGKSILADAAGFATMSAASRFMPASLPSSMSFLPLKGALGTPISRVVVGAAVSVPAAAVDSAVNFAESGKAPNLSDFGKSVYGYAFVGAAFGLGAPGLSKPELSKPESRPEPKPESSPELITHTPAELNLQKAFGAGSPVFDYLQSLQATWPPLNQSGWTNGPVEAVDNWLRQPKSAHDAEVGLSPTALVEDLVARRAPAADFTPPSLSKLYENVQIFGDRPDLLARMALLPSDYSSRAEVSKFLKADPAQNKTTLAMALEQGFSQAAGQLDKLYQTARLTKALSLGADAQIHLYNLQQRGLDAQKLFDTAGSVLHGARIAELLARKAPLIDLSPWRLHDFGQLEKLSDSDQSVHAGFSARQLQCLTNMHNDGLPLAQLRYHLAENPENLAAVKSLLDGAHDAGDMRTFLRLSLFPADVSLPLVDAVKNGAVSAATLVAGARDWHSGRDFVQLLQNHVRNGERIDADTVKALSAKASTPSAIEPPPFEPSIRYPYPADRSEIEDMAGAIKLAASAIKKNIAPETPLVLLGRDAWPLLPLLRHSGRSAQYFMWSRMQIDDTSTARQWHKEIPPGAAVIDTGFHGSVLDAIKIVDSTSSGYLLSSDRPEAYPSLLDGAEFRALVQSLENLPKLTNRSRFHTARGGAITNSSVITPDVDYAGKNGDSVGARFFAEFTNKQLLAGLGLPRWDIWRYSTFVGLTPRERLGLPANIDIEKQYDAVAAARAAYPLNAGPGLRTRQ